MAETAQGGVEAVTIAAWPVWRWQLRESMCVEILTTAQPPKGACSRMP